MQQITYLRASRVGREVLYTVYNSLGQAMLITRNLQWAETIAHSFKSDPSTVVVAVQDLKPRTRKR
jgi:uncharacterized protein YbaP (TraB family)